MTKVQSNNPLFQKNTKKQKKNSHFRRPRRCKRIPAFQIEICTECDTTHSNKTNCILQINMFYILEILLGYELRLQIGTHPTVTELLPCLHRHILGNARVAVASHILQTITPPPQRKANKSLNHPLIPKLRIHSATSYRILGWTALMKDEDSGNP
jgi:hypothetical protein